MNKARLPDADERARALDLGRHVLAMAPAGSGKTGLLVHRLLLALATVDEPEQVVAITFTNKAAAEIRARVLTALRSAAGPAPTSEHAHALHEAAAAVLRRDRERGWELRNHPARLRALTIDAFNAQLAAQLPLLSGIGGPGRVAEDPEGLYAEAVVRLFSELEDAELPDADREALQAVLRLADNRLDRLLPAFAGLLSRREQWLPRLGRLGDEAWERAESEALRALVAARLAELDATLQPMEKQALLDILAELAVAGGPLDWACGQGAWPPAEADALAFYRGLTRLLVRNDGGPRSPKGLNKNFGFPAGTDATRRMKALLEAFERRPEVAAAAAAVQALPDADYPPALRALQRHLIRALRRLAAHLRLGFGQAGEADFPEIALAARAALGSSQGYSDALLEADRRIRHLLVDEMQDTSEGQVELLQLLTQGWQPGDGHSLFLVGDPQQSIYAFRKAEVRLFLQLWTEGCLGSLELDRVALRANFRSAPALIEWFNASFTQIFPARSDPWSGRVAFRPSEAMVKPDPGAGVRLEVSVDAGDADEGERAAARAAELRTAHPQERIAVLARTRPQLAALLAALRRRQIPYACQDVDPLAALPAVRDFVHLARALWHPEDRLAWAVLLRAPFVGLSWADLVALSRGRVRMSWPERLALAAQTEGLSAEGCERLGRLQRALEDIEARPELRGWLAERAEALWYSLGGADCVDPLEAVDVRAAMRLLRQHARSGELQDLEAFERALGQLYGHPAQGAVEVLTVHKAKGLEYDHVVLVGCGRASAQDERGLLQFRSTPQGELLVPRPPAWLDEKDPAHALYDYLQRLQQDSRRNELLRLLYVATTRARRSLHVFIDLCRTEKGELRARHGSFAELLLPVLPSAVVETAAAPPGAEPAIPRSPRLPVAHRPAVDETLYRPRERRTLKPSEAVLQEWDSPRDEGSRYAQWVGTLLHQALQKVAEDGLDAWSDCGSSRRPSLAAGLRRMGLAESQVDSAVDRILDLLQRTLRSTTGRWVLAPRPWARNEYPLAGYRDGHWVAGVVDRCFEDEDGTLWIIDYKATAQPLAAESLEAYLREAVAEYTAQLEQYAALLRELRPGRPVRAALYFLEADRLVEPAGAEPAAA